MKSSQPGNNVGTPIKIEDPNQFVPLNTDPTEVQDKRNRVSGGTISFLKFAEWIFFTCFKHVIIISYSCRSDVEISDNTSTNVMWCLRLICFSSDKRAAQRRSHDSRTQISVISRHSRGHHSRASEYIFSLVMFVTVMQKIFLFELFAVATYLIYFIKQTNLSSYSPLIVP